MEKVFKYDVAISCLDKDRAIAEELLKPLEEQSDSTCFSMSIGKRRSRGRGMAWMC